MIKKNIFSIPSFVSQAQLLVPIMHNRLSEDPSKKIAINKHLLAQQSLVVPIEKADADSIMLEDFLEMLDARIHAEYAYRDEIAQLKDNLCESFNKLCDGVTDKHFITFIRNQRQRVIDTVIDETQIEQKMIAEYFYSDMMNGWDEKALNLEQFDTFAYTILWKPLLTPFPIEALDKLKRLIKELGNERFPVKIEEITTQFISYIQMNLRAKNIKDSDYESSETLRIALEELSKVRKICNVEVRDAWKSERIVQEFASKCVNDITLITCVDKFLQNEPKINYDKLKINGDADVASIKNVAGKVQRRIKELDWNLQYSNIGMEGANAISFALKELKTISTLILNLWYNNIGMEGAKTVSAALKGLKNISTLDLNMMQNNIEDEGAKAVSVALKELKTISTLSLILIQNNIKAGGANAVSAALKELKSISSLTLDLWLNEIEEEGAKAVSVALSELKIISTLNLNLACNNIGVEGAKAVSAALKELKNISTLKLNFWNNNVGVEGANAVSAALKELKNISTLSLSLQENNIGEEGAKAMSVTLKELKNISALTLDLWQNNIGDGGTKALLAALKELKNILTLNLDLMENNIGEEGATAISATLKELNYISTVNLNLQDNNIKEEGEAALEELKFAHSNYQIKYQV